MQKRTIFFVQKTKLKSTYIEITFETYNKLHMIGSKKKIAIVHQHHHQLQHCILKKHNKTIHNRNNHTPLEEHKIHQIQCTIHILSLVLALQEIPMRLVYFNYHSVLSLLVSEKDYIRVDNYIIRFTETLFLSNAMISFLVIKFNQF